MKKLRSVGMYIAIFFILLLAFLLRAHIYFYGDFLFLLDQARDLMLVKEIAINHDVTLIGARSGIGGIFHGPLWLYLLVPSFLLSGGNPFWTLVPVFVLFSLLTVLVGIVVAWKLYGIKEGLIFGLLLSISSLSVESISNYSNAHLMPLIFLLYLLTISLYMRGKDKYIVPSVFLIGIGIHFEVAFSVFLFPITLLAILIRKQIPSLKLLLVSMTAFLLAISTYVMFELKSKFLMTQSIMKLIFGSVDPIKGYEHYADLAFRVGDRATAFITSFNAPMFAQKPFILLLIVTMIFLAGLTIALNTKAKKWKDYEKEYFFLLGVPVIFFSLLLFYPFPIWSHYTLSLYISTILVFVLSLKIISQKFTWGSILSYGLLTLITFPAVIWTYQAYIGNNHSWQNTESLYLSQVKMVEWVFNDAQRQKFGYLVYTPQILTYQMDYLFWWVGKQENNTNYTNNKENTTYLVLLKPETGDKSAHVYWKENVIHTQGEVIKKQIFKHNNIVEKINIITQEPPVDPNYFKGLLFR